MRMPKIVLGVLPTKRHPRDLATGIEQKERLMKVIRNIDSDIVEIVDLDDVLEGGIIASIDQADAAINKFINARVDALFIAHTDFGNEQSVSAVAARLNVPTLVWGADDEAPKTNTHRARDTQCGMFACTKVLSRMGVMFSYIWNVSPETDDFKKGYDTFIRTVNIVKSVRGLRIAQFGTRPDAFMSVTSNEGELATRYGIVCVPISHVAISAETDKIIAENSPELQEYLADMTSRMSFGDMEDEYILRHAAVTLAIESLMKQNGCTVGAMECWVTGNTLGLGQSRICMNLGELADRGYPISCETDINGAVSLAMLRAVGLGRESEFFADLTIRDTQNQNSELLWHCGPFPYSLKDPDSPASVERGREQFKLKTGDITVCRFDELDGKHYLFCGEGKGIDGPFTTGTYIYFQVSNWKRWEEKLMFGPYIHHVGGVYGNYKAAMREAARYLGLIFDDPEEQGIYSL